MKLERKLIFNLSDDCCENVIKNFINTVTQRIKKKKIKCLVVGQYYYVIF